MENESPLSPRRTQTAPSRSPQRSRAPRYSMGGRKSYLNNNNNTRGRTYTHSLEGNWQEERSSVMHVTPLPSSSQRWTTEHLTMASGVQQNVDSMKKTLTTRNTCFDFQRHFKPPAPKSARVPDLEGTDRWVSTSRQAYAVPTAQKAMHSSPQDTFNSRSKDIDAYINRWTQKPIVR
eukprot:TRINITY_DN3347_c0_g1_i1.p1 TRINITY_DN3347_c0_g1~~TRINITY_DN3347_c0_g1_i1.p1  ORF type:complete len:177 (-),score=0.87 TRINITY_DN3347_c0_g1_i1:30-560(-)